MVDVAKDAVKILAQRHIAVGMDDDLAADTEAGETEVPVAPLVVECYIVVVLAGAMDGSRDAGGEVGGGKEVAGGIEECHSAVDAYPHVDMVLQGQLDDILHVVETVPRRKTEHERQRQRVFQCLDCSYHAVISVAAPHAKVGLTSAVEGEVEVFGTVLHRKGGKPFGVETVGEEGEVGVVVHKPIEYLACLGVQDKLAAFKPHGGAGVDASALHHTHNVVEGKMLMGLFPDGTVPTVRLACRGGVNHQLAQLLVARTQGVVGVEQPAGEVIGYFVHFFCLLRYSRDPGRYLNRA